MSNYIQNRHSFNIKTNNSNNLENVIRYSYPNSRPGILYPNFDIPIKKSTTIVNKRLSNKSVDSQDSGIGLSKTDYEIRRAIKAQRIIERPHIIVLHKGKPVTTSYNNRISEDLDADAHMIISAATASKRHRREIAVMQKRNTIISSSSSSSSPSLSPSPSSLSSPSSSSLSNNGNFEKENMFNGFEFTRSSNIETDVTREGIDIYDEKKKFRGCSFLKSKPSIKRVSSVLKKLVGREKSFMTCVYVN